MKKIVFFIFLLILPISFILFSREDCRTIKLFMPTYSFKNEHFKACFSKYYLKENIKNILRAYPFLYNAANKLNKSLTKRKRHECIFKYRKFSKK